MSNEKQEPKAEAKTEKPEAKKGPVVADGKSITSRRGIRGPGDSISEDDIGKESFESLKKAGFIVNG